MKSLLGLAWCFGLVGLLWQLTDQTRHYGARHFELLSPPPLAQFKTPMLNLLTFGYRELYDQMVAVWALQFLADERLPQQKAEAVYGAIRTITRHRPKVEYLYMTSCFVLDATFQRPDLCEPITLDGLTALPNSWRIPVTQGFFSLYKLNEPQKAASFYGLAASRPHAPQFLSKLTRNLLKNHRISPTDLKQSLKILSPPSGSSKLGLFLNSLHQQQSP